VTSVEIKDLANWAQAQPNDYCVMLPGISLLN